MKPPKKKYLYFVVEEVCDQWGMPFDTRSFDTYEEAYQYASQASKFNPEEQAVVFHQIFAQDTDGYYTLVESYL